LQNVEEQPAKLARVDAGALLHRGGRVELNDFTLAVPSAPSSINLSFSTIRTCVRQIYRRFGVHGRAELLHAMLD